MVYGCGNKCIKFLVITFNLLICIAGALVFGVSLWANLDTKFEGYWEQLHTGVDLTHYKVGIWVLVGVGAFLFITGFLGCCGAMCESACLLGIFFTIVLICFCIELVGIILAFTMKARLKTAIEDGVKESLKTEEGKKGLGELQNSLVCCGVNGAQEAGVSTCPVKGQGIGCVQKLWELVKDNAVIAGAVCGGILVIELLAMIFSCCMCSAIRSGKYGYA